MAFKIAVIGAGVNGLASALCLSHQFPDCEITVIASEFYPEKKNLCSAHGFGVVINRETGVLDSPNVTKHVLATMKFCASLHPTEAEYAGIRPSDAVVLFNQKKDFIDSMISVGDREKLGFRNATRKEIEMFNHMNDGGAKLVLFENFEEAPLTIFTCPAYIIDTSKYLPWLKNKLLQKCKRNGDKMVTFFTKEVTSFVELSPTFDLVVNCSGCGAKTLASDPMVIPIRGQYIKAHVPSVDKVYVAASTVICPVSNHVCIGATHQLGRFETHVIPEDTEKFLYKFKTLLPSFGKPEVILSDVGIRPGRVGGARLEVEVVKVKESSGNLPVVHNYGHGYRGIGQHWGCALDVAQIAVQVLGQGSKL
uniref:D-aspartate oxidase-like n=1 Tax=Phallusia mammillata TaxID=59560 RepID=A0A6F9DA25_9ASCI|nr:D-aspartate oxidase-like [Phallusia mammillata]